MGAAREAAAHPGDRGRTRCPCTRRSSTSRWWASLLLRAPAHHAPAPEVPRADLPPLHVRVRRLPLPASRSCATTPSAARSRPRCRSTSCSRSDCCCSRVGYVIGFSQDDREHDRAARDAGARVRAAAGALPALKPRSRSRRRRAIQLSTSQFVAHHRPASRRAWRSTSSTRRRWRTPSRRWTSACPRISARSPSRQPPSRTIDDDDEEEERPARRRERAREATAGSTAALSRKDKKGKKKKRAAEARAALASQPEPKRTEEDEPPRRTKTTTNGGASRRTRPSATRRRSRRGRKAGPTNRGRKRPPGPRTSRTRRADRWRSSSTPAAWSRQSSRIG